LQRSNSSTDVRGAFLLRAYEPGFLRPPLLVLSPARQLAGEALMDRTVAHFNIEHYRKLLTQEMDEAKRQTIVRLLADEEAKLVSLTNPPQQKVSP
jgi:hypothetical protein